jgi:hypothetical protein
MRKAMIPAFLLVLGAVVLGSTVFREQLARAATPFEHVIVANTTTNPVPVHQVGTSTTSVSGTVGIDSTHNTVKLDPSGNTVNLDSTDAANLATVKGDLNNLKFDSGGNLETTAQSNSPAAVTQQCFSFGSRFDVPFGGTKDALCQNDFYATNITASGMDDDMVVDFEYKGNEVLQLRGSSADGADSYQLDLTHPLHVDEIDAFCNNSNTDCFFSLAVLGNSTGS